jgi:hypothetical protein
LIDGMIDDDAIHYHQPSRHFWRTSSNKTRPVTEMHKMSQTPATLGVCACLWFCVLMFEFVRACGRECQRVSQHLSVPGLRGRG